MPPKEDASTDTAAVTPGDAGNSAPTPGVDANLEDNSVEAAMDAARQTLAEDNAAAGTGDAASAPAVVPDATSTAIPAGAPAGGGFLDVLREVWPDHTYATEADAANAFKELRGKLSEKDRLAQIGAKVLPKYDAFEEWERSQAAGQANVQSVPQGPERSWKPPHEFDPSWLNEMAKEESERNPAAMQRFNEFQDYAADRWRKWMFDPNTLVEDVVMPAVEARFADAEKEREVRASVSSVIDQNRDLCVKYDAQISQLMREGMPLKGAIAFMKQHDELLTLRGAQTGTTPTSIPGAQTAAAAPAGTPAAVPGVVPQTPAGEPKASEEDIERWADGHEAGKAALASLGFAPTPQSLPGTI